MTWDDVYDVTHEEFYSHITVVERKTGKTKIIALNAQIIQALRLYSSRASKTRDDHAGD